ncbi:hypothetical protein GCM10020331_023800 [Ectobacillus funiculus]
MKVTLQIAGGSSCAKPGFFEPVLDLFFVTEGHYEANKANFFMFVSVLVLLVIVVPSLLVLPYHVGTKQPATGKEAASTAASAANVPQTVTSNVEVAVYRTKQKNSGTCTS